MREELCEIRQLSRKVPGQGITHRIQKAADDQTKNEKNNKHKKFFKRILPSQILPQKQKTRHLFL